MLIPSIDLMGGKIVQLVQGERKALEFSDFDLWVKRFARYPIVQLIDLDSAMDRGSNRELISWFCQRLPCQVGGGIRNAEVLEDVVMAGARRAIIGSALLKEEAFNTALAQEMANAVGAERLVFAVDSWRGRVATHGWKHATDVTPTQLMRDSEQFCAAFLYTHIDTEGLMTGFPREIIADLRAASSRRLIVAGGITSMEEVEELDLLGADAVVGMALYTGKLKLDQEA